MRRTTATILGSLFWILALSACVNVSRTDSPCIALTLDDGPNPPYTEKFLALLDRHRVRATFFLVGQRIPLYPATVERVIRAGHELGNHSWHHEHLAMARFSKIAAEVQDTDAAIRNLGYTGPIPFRAPFGTPWGFHTLWLWWNARQNVLYDIEPIPPDYHRRSPTEIAASALQRVRPGSIVLLHDGPGIRSESLEAAALLLPALREKGFCFTTVGELSDPKAPRL
ncbi:polysaccharide deacetylase family protein [bacterium]|nr:polysaccharide deacetylase family protein [bacterium]